MVGFRAVIVFFIFGIIFGIIIGILFIEQKVSFTGNSVLQADKPYSYTKAICNSEKECIDVVVYCEGGSVKKIEPIVRVVQYDLNWSDPRENSTNQYC